MSCEIVDGLELHGIGVNQLAFQVSSTGFHPFTIGTFLSAMEMHSPRLGAAFYQQLSRMLNDMTYCYDADNASQTVEWWKEMHEEECEEGQSLEEYLEQNDIVIPAIITPDFLEKGLKQEECCRILKAAQDGPFSRFVRLLCSLEKYSIARRRDRHKLFPALQQSAYDCWDDNTPLPLWVVHFDGQDGVMHVFDQMCDTLHECTHEPDFLVCVPADDEVAIASALRMMAAYLDFQSTAFDLLTSIEEWASTHKEDHVRDSSFNRCADLVQAA